MAKRLNFDQQLKAYLTFITTHYKIDRIEGMFFLVHAFYSEEKKHVFNKVSFTVHYTIGELEEYCKEILPRQWEYDYYERNNLYVDVYMCCLCTSIEDIKYSLYAKGNYENSDFNLKIQ